MALGSDKDQGLTMAVGWVAETGEEEFIGHEEVPLLQRTQY